MLRERVIPVAVSVLVIILVAVVQDRSRYLASLIATMPLTAPLAMWIVFSASGGEQREMADFVASLVVGSIATLIFVVACWVGFRQAWGFGATLTIAAVVWVAIVLVAQGIGRWLG